MRFSKRATEFSPYLPSTSVNICSNNFVFDCFFHCDVFGVCKKIKQLYLEVVPKMILNSASR